MGGIHRLHDGIRENRVNTEIERNINKNNMPNVLPEEQDIRQNSPFNRYKEWFEALDLYREHIENDNVGGYCEIEITQEAQRIFGCRLDRECYLKDEYDNLINELL